MKFKLTKKKVNFACALFFTAILYVPIKPDHYYLAQKLLELGLPEEWTLPKIVRPDTLNKNL